MSRDDITRRDDGAAGDPWEDRLSDYLDGELGAADRDRCERHLATCASCREAIDDLRALVAHASALGRPAPPPRDLWPGVARRLEPRGTRWFGGVRATPWLAPGLAAAAVLVLASVAAIFWLRQTGATDVGQTAARRAPAPAAGATSLPAPAADLAYEDSIAELRRSARARLAADAQVVSVLDDNVSALDRAIAAYRDALADNPGDEQLRRRLADARHRKLDLLRHAAGAPLEGTN